MGRDSQKGTAVVSPISKTFNSRLTARVASDSGLILPKRFGLDRLYGPDGELGLSGHPYNTGEVRDLLPGMIGEDYLKACSDTGVEPSDEARDLIGITTTGREHSVTPETGLLIDAGTPLHDFATIPITQKDYTGASTAMVDHYLKNPHEPIGVHPKMNVALAAGHYRHPGDTSPEAILGGRIAETAQGLFRLNKYIGDALHTEITRPDLTEQDVGQGYMKAVKRLLPLFEPEEVRDESGDLRGWKPPNPTSKHYSLRNPIPLHHGIERLLKNMFHSSASQMMLDDRVPTENGRVARSIPGDERDYDRYLISRVPTMKLGLDVSPINILNHHGDSYFMLRDFQDYYRALDSKDPILRQVANKHLRRSGTRDGSIDFTGLTPRASVAPGNLAWESGANQSAIMESRKSLAAMASHGVRSPEAVLPQDAGLSAGTRERVEEILNPRTVVDRPPVENDELSRMVDLYGF